MIKPYLEVADVFRKYGEEYRIKYGSQMSLEQCRVMRAIETCRTPALGGHVNECDSCGHQLISYNSCRNRHCPKCQSLAKAEWLQARQAELLPVEYYHLVFTLPDLLRPIALQNKSVFHSILFQSVSQTLLSIASDPAHLGATIGFVAVLHTWGQNLMYHPHVHCVVPGGGLAPHGQDWITCRAGFFLPVRVLSRLYRRLFLEALEKAFDQGELQFQGSIQPLSSPQAFEKLLQSCRKMEWVVYSKPPFDGPQRVLDYLGRYTHRIAISNHRLVSMDNGQVSFTYRDYQDGHARKTMTLEAEEFIRRFLLHVLPDGFVRIRYYGLLANRHRAEKLALCRKLLNMPEECREQIPQKLDWVDLLITLTGKDPLLCPKCQQGRLVRIQTLPATASAPAPHTRAPPGAYLL